jgi:conjugal transfer pilus assembly protein TraV
MNPTPTLSRHVRQISLYSSLALSIVLTGCVSMSGLSGSSDFKCRAPDGVSCVSVSGIYANAQANNLPSQRDAKPTLLPSSTKDTKPSSQTVAFSSSAPTTTPSSLSPSAPLGAIRSEPRIVRVWIAPWEDSDGDLHDQSYVYLPVDSGRWVVEHNKRRVREAYAPVRAPRQTQSSPSADRSAPNTDPGAFDPSTLPAAIRAASELAQVSASPSK